MKENPLFLPGSVLVAGLLIAGAVLWNGQNPGTGGIAGAGGAAPTTDIKNVDTTGNPSVGNANAPVTIAYWTDFECPFCQKFEEETYPSIVETYVNTGKVKVVFMDLPLTSIHPNALTIALYGRAVWNLYPDRYLAWREATFAAQGQGFGTPASIDALNATIAGLDAAKITADVQANAEAYTADIQRDMEEAQEQGVNATPSFVIGTQLIAGAYPFEAFQAAIDPLLQ